jgi:hypothetical protein
MARPVNMTGRNQKPETQFRRAALKYLKLAYGQHFFCLPIVGGPFQPPGSPDVVCSIRGLFVAIEFKAPGKGRAGPRQQEIIDEIRAAGGRAGIASNWEELQALVEGIEPVQQSFMLKTGRKI